MKNIFLIGFMGCGKSAISSHMSQVHGMTVIEMDEEIVRKEGISIPDIFEKKGEKYFRESETQLLYDIQAMENVVVSCGGGVVLREENVLAMKKDGVVVWLTASPETIFERVKDDENRPLLIGNKNVTFIQNMMKERQPKYESAADIVVNTDGKSVKDICNEVLERIQ